MLASNEPREHRPHLCRLSQPQTKRASAGRCLRLLPIVQGEQLASPPHDGRFAHYARIWCAVEIVQANGLELAYERVGEGPPLVFIHAAAEDSHIWR